MASNFMLQWSNTEGVKFYELDDSGKLEEDKPAVSEANGSPLYDEVFRLREWGTHWSIPLRVLAGYQHLDSLSSRYATRTFGGVELSSDGGLWKLKDCTGDANLKQDGVPAREVALLVGTEITIAGRTLVAESPRAIALQAFFSRLLGWRDERADVVDQALRALRLACSRRAMLVLRGGGDLVPVALAIHQYALGREAPFVVSDPRRNDVPATIRSPANCKSGLHAFHKASEGTLCVRARRLPSDLDDALKAFQAPDSSVRLLICVGCTGRERFSMAVAPIDIPSLKTRPEELERIIEESAADALEGLWAPRSCLDKRDIEWVSQLPDLTIPTIDDALRRVAAIKISRNMSIAARSLGMAPVSLRRWLDRRMVLSDGTSYVPQVSSAVRVPKYDNLL